MKKKIKKHRSLPHLKKHQKKEQHMQPVLGLGPKMVNSVIIALEEGDDIHIRKIVEGLDEYDLAKLIEALTLPQRR